MRACIYRSTTKPTKWPVHPAKTQISRSAWASCCMRTTKTLIRRGRCPAWFESSLGAQIIFIPRHTKSGGVLCYTLWKFWVSVRPSVSASFPDSNLSSFWPIFFKLCMDIDIGEEWVWDCKWAKFVYKQKSYNNNNNCLYFTRNTQLAYIPIFPEALK